MEAQPNGHAQLFPISETRPLSRCRHYVASARVEGVADEVDASTTEFERVYQGLGVVPLGTVIDGDCGLDVMTTMLSRPQTFEARKELRATYLVKAALV